MVEQTPYEVYIHFYGKIKSGTPLEPNSYGINTAQGYKRFDEDQTIAATLAIEDVKSGSGIRTRTEFNTQLSRLKG